MAVKQARAVLGTFRYAAAIDNPRILCMNVITSTIYRPLHMGNALRRARWHLGLITMLLLPTAQASQALCSKVTAPSTQALLSTCAHPPAPEP